jgi:AcrR family transcriptional regulator
MSDNDPNPILRDTVSHNPAQARGSIAKDARAQRSSAALQGALLRLLELKAFDQITVRDICAEAGVHYATFFRHQASKETLLEDIAAEQIATLVNLTLPIKEAAGDRTAFHALCSYVDEHWRLWAILLNGGAAGAMREEWLRRARIVAETAEPVASWLPKELGTICSTSLIAETISWWLGQPEGLYSVDDVSRMLDRLVGSSTLKRDTEISD